MKTNCRSRRMNQRTLIIAIAATGLLARAQSGDDAPVGLARPGQTMKQVTRGVEYAAASMAPQATLTAERVLRSGGNAFDAIVAGQAVLGIVQPSANGLGSDAVLLIYDAKQGKVVSLNAEG